jgi:23S rRNA (cytosine1962-C5)-methyltransferase
MRLVHAESDGFPGLVVDRYGQWLSLQALSSGVERWLPQIVNALEQLTGLHNIYERSDVDVRRLEGLAERTGVLAGEAPPPRMLIHENGVDLWVDLISGHKTGYYLDQRRNRQRLRSLAAGRRVLDCFCYSGGFSVNALAGGAASLTLVDASAEALDLARANLANVTQAVSLPDDVTQTVTQAVSLHDDVTQAVSLHPHDAPIDFIQGDVFQQLRQMRDRARSFDLIILDPPKFAPTVSQVERAARGYKDINLLAFKLLAPGGLLVTFSCSGGVSSELFQKIVAGAALDAGVDAQIVERLSQDNDHPVALNFPEGEYLKGLVVEVG